MPKIISKAKKKIISAPATAKELTSIPIRLRICSPKNKNPIMISPATNEAFSDWIWPTFWRSPITMGILPTMSMTANNTMVQDFVSSRINADTRSLLSRIKIENNNLELISGSLLEVGVKFDLRNSLSVPDTSIMIEGDKSYVYRINEKNIANKTEVNTGLRGNKNIEIISGLSEGDIIVAEGLKKVRPQGKIKPINK